MKIKQFTYIFLFTVFSIIARGYEYGVGNQIHYFTYLNYFLDPSLYQNDYLLKMHTIPYTIFITVLKFLPLNIFGLQLTVFILYFILLYIFYLGIYLIVKNLFSNKSIPWITLFFFIFPIPVGGSSIDTVEKELNPRFVAESFFILSIYFLIVKKTVISSITAAVGFLFNPLILVPYIPIVTISWLFKYLKTKQFVISAVLFTVISSPLLNVYVFTQKQVSFFIDKEWKDLIIERLSYIFALRWSLVDWVLLFIMVIFFVIYARFYKLNAVLKASIITGLLLVAGNIISDIFSLRIGVQLQLTRDLYLVELIAIILGVQILSILVPKYLYRFLPFIIVTVGLTLTFNSRISDGILWYTPLNDYEKTAVWANTNTTKDSLFLVPLDYTGFRFWSKRSVVVESKEGGDSLYDRSFGIEWDRREDLIENNYYMMDLKRIESLRKTFRFNYLVTTETLPVQVAFTSGSWKIYSF